MKSIKAMNDFVLGIVMLAVSAFLLFSNSIVENMPSVSPGGFFARSDVYIRMLAAILAFVSLIIIIKSINFKKEETKKFEFAINSTIILSSIGLILYTIFLPIIGFTISTFIMTFFLCTLYTIRERDKKVKEFTQSELIKMAVRAVIYSIIMVIVLWFVFTKGLSVQLP